MSEIPLTPRPLLDRARRLWQLTQEGPEETRIMHAILFCNLNVPELMAEVERLQQENTKYRDLIDYLRRCAANEDALSGWWLAQTIEEGLQ